MINKKLFKYQDCVTVIEEEEKLGSQSHFKKALEPRPLEKKNQEPEALD